MRPQLARFAQLYRNRIEASQEFLEVIFLYKKNTFTNPSTKVRRCHQVKEGQCVQDCGHLARLHHLEL